jgi:hypothetical protein
VGAKRVRLRFWIFELWEWNEVEVRGFGATVHVLLIGGTSGFRVFDAELGVGEVETLERFEEANILFHVGESFSGVETFQDANFGRGANRAEKSVGILLVLNLHSESLLSEDNVAWLRDGTGKEAAESATGGSDAESAVGPRLSEDLDHLVVVLAGAEVEDVFAVLLRKGRALVTFFFQSEFSHLL